MKYKMIIRNDSEFIDYYSYNLYQQRKFLWFNYWSWVFVSHYNRDVSIDDLIEAYKISYKHKEAIKAEAARFPIEVIKDCE